jgi:hypothetical protein
VAAITPSGRLVRISVQITPEQHDWLRARADRVGESLPTVLRQLLRDAMDAERAKSEAA